MSAFIPLFVVFLSVIFSAKYKNKYIFLLFAIWLFCMQIFKYHVYMHLTHSAELPISLASSYIEAKNPNKNVYVSTFKQDKELFNVKHYDKLRFSLDSTTLNMNEDFKNDPNAILFSTYSQLYSNLDEKDYDKKCYYCSAATYFVCKIEKKDK